MQFPRSDNDLLRAYGVPKNLLVEFRVLSKPATLVRDVTLTALNVLDAAGQRPSKDTRQILTGPSGCGKSSVLLQAAEYCIANEWIVLYIPRAIEFVNSSTTYVYDPRTRTYVQPDASYQILRRFMSVNSELLQSLTTQGVFHMEDGESLPAGLPLADFIEVGIEDRSLAPAILSALMAELSRQTAYPVLFAVDDAQALYRSTLYRDPHGHILQPHHLSVPRLILEYASGKKSLARGAFLGAVSTAHTQFQMPLELSEALGIPFPRPAGPYVKRIPEVVTYAQGLQNFPVPAELSVPEAASLFEVWAEDKALHSGEVRGEDGELHSVPNDELFMTKYCEAAGNARAFVWKGLLSTLSSLT
ncbi:mitochondrial ribosomal death-associated protein 3-domain-containing protein [Amylocystis lapponica]|nr:mitochondrial ribosomal death-associated protein 3-domain-containing protein [Amylocystis lapponica]